MTSSSNKETTLSTRYFYVPSTQYGQHIIDGESNNILSDSTDPLQLNQKQKNNLVFYEWQIPNNESIVCPPSAACVLIVVSVTYEKKVKEKLRKKKKINNDLNGSDSENGVVKLEEKENFSGEEGNLY